MTKLLHIPYLDTVLIHVFLDINVCALESQVLEYPKRRTYSEWNLEQNPFFLFFLVRVCRFLLSNRGSPFYDKSDGSTTLTYTNFCLLMEKTRAKEEMRWYTGFWVRLTQNPLSRTRMEKSQTPRSYPRPVHNLHSRRVYRLDTWPRISYVTVKSKIGSQVIQLFLK